jgi:hypothetical protein
MAAKVKTSASATQSLLSKEEGQAAVLHRPPATTHYPGCMAHLVNIRARWISARTACLAHDENRARTERFRRGNNWLTLILAVLTAVSAVLVPVTQADNPSILALTIITAILTSVSKVVEQTFARPEDIGNHLVAAGNLIRQLEKLNVIAGELHQYVLGQRDLNLQDIDGQVRSMGDAIEETRRNHAVAESKENIARAEKDFESTPIHLALALTWQVATQFQFSINDLNLRIDNSVKATR